MFRSSSDLNPSGETPKKNTKSIFDANSSMHLKSHSNPLSPPQRNNATLLQQQQLQNIGEMTPSSLNSTGFPLNSKKRVLYSPSGSSTPARPTQRSHFNGNTNIISNNHIDNKENENMNIDSFKNTSPSNLVKKVALRRSAGFLNLSIETSPKGNTIESINHKKSVTDSEFDFDSNKNDITKSFNELYFTNNDDEDNGDEEVARNDSKQFKKPSSVRNNNNNTFVNNLTPQSNASSPFLNPNNLSTTSKKPSTASRFKKIFSNSSSSSVPATDIKNPIIVSTPLDLKKLSPNSLNIKSSMRASPLDSPSKPDRTRQPSNSNAKLFFSSSGHQQHTPSTTASSSFMTPASFKSVKPLQTAFSSTGLQSKKYVNSSKSKVMPETPRKKQPQTLVDANGSFGGGMNTSFGSSDSSIISTTTGVPETAQTAISTVATSTSSSTSSTDPRSASVSPPHSSRMTPRSTNRAIKKDSSGGSSTTSSGTKIPRSQRAVNTSDLQSCILRFTNEFDDFYDDENNSNTSIFRDNNSQTSTKSHHSYSQISSQNSNSSSHNNDQQYQQPLSSQRAIHTDHSQQVLQQQQKQQLLQQQQQQQQQYQLHQQQQEHQHQQEQQEHQEELHQQQLRRQHLTQRLQQQQHLRQLSQFGGATNLQEDDDMMDEDLDFERLDEANFEGFSGFESMENLPPTPTRLVVHNNNFNNRHQQQQQIQFLKQADSTPTKHISYWQRARSTTNANNLNVDTSVKSPFTSMLPPTMLPSTPSVNHSPKTPIDPIFNVYCNTQFLQPSLSQKYDINSGIMTHDNSSASSIRSNLSSHQVDNHQQLQLQLQLQQQNAKKKNSIDSHLMSKFNNCNLIGSGEFSIVFEIQYEGFKYAVKRTKNQLGGPKTRLRKLEEVEILKILQASYYREEGDEEGGDSNEYVLNLINFWEHNSYLYIMTDCCENGSLDKFLVENGKISKLDEWRVWKILIEMLMGLKFIHKCGILHLDLKPANIFVTFEGSLKIGDFGVASKLPIPPYFDREGDREYIAPEVISKHVYGKPADIFSCGLIMVEIAANIVLPDNGTSWQKLRSGDLTDAGKLSSSDLTDLEGSLFSGNTTYSSNLTNTTTGTSNTVANVLNHHHNLQQQNGNNSNSEVENTRLSQIREKLKIPDYAPTWFYDGSSSLDKLVSWMIDPNPELRPTAEEILRSFECQVVESRRKSGATIYEGDFGPRPDDADLNKEKDIKSYKIANVCGSNNGTGRGDTAKNWLGGVLGGIRKSSIDMILE